MKIISHVFITMVSPALLFAAGRDTTVFNDVRIVSGYSMAIFPESWQGSTIHAAGEQIAPEELKRAELIIIKALKKYPRSLLTLTLRNVYLLKSLSFYNVSFGGTNSSDAVYITNNGKANGYTDAYIEQTFHHEYSSILFRDYSALLDTVAWKKQNDPGFDYNDPENGVGAIENNESSQELSATLAQKGMLTQYALSSLENDINTIAQNLFKPAPDFWDIAEHYPKIRTKVKLLISFYRKLSPVFTEQYFKSFNKTTN